MIETKPYTSIGGQAIIEGVLMRSPHYLAMAVRRPDGKIVVKHEEYHSWSKRFPILKRPVLRGVVTLIESMILGMRALSFSAEVASEGTVDAQGDAKSDAAPEKLTGLAIAASMAFALVFGMGLFVALPHYLTALLSNGFFGAVDLKSPGFHLVDGIIKMGILLTYVWAISLMDDIKRVFQYHGAEHKSIYAFESGDELTVENAARQSTLHPRCGTSFLLFLVLISVIVFSFVFPLLGISELSTIPLVNHLIAIVTKIFLMLPVAGLSYEFIKACAVRMGRPTLGGRIWQAMMWPGLMLQHLTTRAPDASQLEVALVSLRRVLELEKSHVPGATIEVASLSDIRLVAATVAEFPEH